ncbi:MAG: hypothetical protein ACJ71Q_05885 [Terriglobales bacterium]
MPSQEPLRIFLAVRLCRVMFLQLTILAMAALASSCQLSAQASPNSGTPERPPILGTLDAGKYSNPMIGFELQLDPQCVFQDEARDSKFSRTFSQRLTLTLSCGPDRILLSSLPLHADEHVNLKRDAQISLEGTVNGGGFQKRGRWKEQTVGATKVLVQEIAATSDTGPQSGFYYALMIGRQYLSILTIGPEADKALLGEFLSKMSLKPNAQ